MSLVLRRPQALVVAAILMVGLAACSAARTARTRNLSDRASVATSVAAPTSTTASRADRSRPASKRAPRFAIIDASFIGAQGWVLGSVACGGRHRCAALARSSDNGLTWHRLPAPPAHIDDPEHPNNIDDTDCRNPCVSQVTFVTSKVGYLFDGFDALFITTDAGYRWRRQPGGAAAIIPDGNSVWRITWSAGCPPGCRYRVLSSKPGSRSWARVALPHRWYGDDIAVTRHGVDATVDLFGLPIGGADDAHSTLLTSTDDGATWTSRGEPCQPETRYRREIDSVQTSETPNGTLGVWCRVRADGTHVFVATSTNNGESFHTGRSHSFKGYFVTAFAVVGNHTVLISTAEEWTSRVGGTYRSTNKGHTFTRVTAPLNFVSFIDATTGHGITTDERAIVTTTNAGRTWHASTIR